MTINATILYILTYSFAKLKWSNHILFKISKECFQGKYKPKSSDNRLQNLNSMRLRALIFVTVQLPILYWFVGLNVFLLTYKIIKLSSSASRVPDICESALLFCKVHFVLTSVKDAIEYIIFYQEHAVKV